MKNVAVFFGGISVEHDVSVITGVMTLNSIDKTKFNPIPVYVNNEGYFTGDKLFGIDDFSDLNLKDLDKVTFVNGSPILYKVKKEKKLKPIGEISVAINAMHGGLGEEGGIIGVLKSCNVAVVSPDLLASSVCMDKGATKVFLKGLGIKTVQGVCTDSLERALSCVKKIGYPVMVKPYKLGSSIGVKKVDGVEELKSAFYGALRYGDKVIVEECLTDFIEINCACYKNGKGELNVSQCERPIGKEEILTFSDKYLDGEREFPADLPLEVSEKIRKTTKNVYSALSMTGSVRMDYFYKDKEVYLNEINTVPGSLAYYLFSDTLKGFSDILTEQITLAEENFAKDSSMIKKFNSTILKSCGNKCSKHL